MQPHAYFLPRALPCAALHEHCNLRCMCSPAAKCARASQERAPTKD